MLRRFLGIALVFAGLTAPIPSSAAQAPIRHYLMSCQTTPDIECIKSITAISPAGTRSKATAPYRSVEVIGDINPIDVREEWAFDGFTFEGSAGNKAVPGIVYRPEGSEDCNAARCLYGLEELQFGIQASWLNGTLAEQDKLLVDLSRRGSQYLCGTKEAPTRCHRNFNFDTAVSFEIEVRMPIQFEPSALMGSVKNLTFTKGKEVETIKGIAYRNLVVRFDPQVLQRPLFSNLVPDPMGTSQYADFVSDAANFWIIGKNSTQVSSLGKCAGVPFVTILSDSIYQGLPTWNPSTQSIDVGLTAPHFNVDGSIHKGYFEASISKEMGRCLWGIDLSTKSVAKMSITYSGETGQEVQTVSGRFDGENYILFSANFHYSSPKISLKMQDPVMPEISKVSKTIKCVRGKTTKSFSGANPKCPAGFKQR
jgi:hypothetical protein